MLSLICDIETNGLLHELDRVHCIVLRDVTTGEVWSCADQDGYVPLEKALELISVADKLIGHNLINFDVRALKKVYPRLNLRHDCDIVDTLIMSRVLWPELDPVDEQKFSHIDKKYRGRHSLAAWGERLGVAKIKFQENQKKDPDVDNVWAHWNAEMQEYCIGDTLVTQELYEYFLTQELDPRCHKLEHDFAKVMALQEEFGFPFNEKAAFALVNTLKARRSELDDQLQGIFPPIIEERISAKTGRKLKTKVTTFNAGSRQQIADRLRERYPEIKFDQTEKGNPKVDDDVLEILGEKYPEAKVLAEYQLLNKRLGQIADGKEAWLKHCQKYGDSRIHGGVKTNACVSGRCSHVSPNMAQVPSVGHTYGAECRALFTAPEGWMLIGTDAAGLELRALGAWLAHFDGGEYAKLVSTDGFDVHTYNAKLFGIYDGQGEIQKATRDLSKRLIYALLYGAGAKKVVNVQSIRFTGICLRLRS
jgi:DNA polymerase I